MVLRAGIFDPMDSKPGFQSSYKKYGFVSRKNNIQDQGDSAIGETLALQGDLSPVPRTHVQLNRKVLICQPSA